MDRVNTQMMLLDELKAYGNILLDLISKNKLRAIEHPDDSYFLGKVDAYEVAYEDFIRRIKKVNSYGRNIA